MSQIVRYLDRAGFFLRPLEKSNFWGEIQLLKNELLKLKYLNAHMTAKLHFFIDVNLQWKELRTILIFWWAVEGTTCRGAANHYFVLK